MRNAKGRVADVTRLLHEWSHGRREALDGLFPLIYDELHSLARQRMSRERSNHTLQATALVHEAFVRLVDQRVAFENRSHFFSIAAQCMRRVLIDHARRRRADKRPPPAGAVSLDEAAIVDDAHVEQVLIVDEALQQLARLDERQARVAELRYFGGLENAEIANVLGVSLATVKRDWLVAKLWLRKALKAS